MICEPNSWHEEDGALEVETGECNYLSVSQPSLVSIVPGDQLHLVLWHANLRFEEPAEAHAAISIGEHIIWQREIDIPSESHIFDVTLDADVYAAVGERVEFHLHNHGFNTWKLLTFEIEN